MILDLYHRIRRGLIKIRLQPIRVFCFHQVSDVFEASTMWECDWTQIDQFKKNILHLKEHYSFISLTEAHDKIQHDRIRYKRYAVLTADDGWATMKNIIPWLAEQKIPITLFINPAYLDGKHYQSRDTEKLLTENDIKYLANTYPQYISIASHGFKHTDAHTMSEEQYINNVDAAEIALQELNNTVNFYAFTYGHYRRELLSILNQRGLVPVLMDGEKNYSYNGVIHRECIDGIKIE